MRTRLRLHRRQLSCAHQARTLERRDSRSGYQRSGIQNSQRCWWFSNLLSIHLFLFRVIIVKGSANECATQRTLTPFVRVNTHHQTRWGFRWKASHAFCSRSGEISNCPWMSTSHFHPRQVSWSAINAPAECRFSVCVSLAPVAVMLASAGREREHRRGRWKKYQSSRWCYYGYFSKFHQSSQKSNEKDLFNNYTYETNKSKNESQKAE